MQSKWKIMTAMLKLVRPLWAWMVLAVLLGVAGFFCSILITVLGFNLLGDGLRDAFDPKLRS